MTAASPLARAGTRKEAASPPLIFGARRAGYGGRSSGLKGASRFLRKWPAATLDPGDLGGPWGRKSGQAQGLPRARRAARRSVVAGGRRYPDAREQMNRRSIVRRRRRKLHKSRPGLRSPVVVLRYLFDPGWCAVSW